MFFFSCAETFCVRVHRLFSDSDIYKIIKNNNKKTFAVVASEYNTPGSLID